MSGKFMRRGVLGMLLAMALSWTVTVAAAEQTPDKLIEDSAKAMLADIDAHRDEYRQQPDKLRAVVDKYLLPHFDTQYAARLVLAKYWRDANDAQRKAFVDAFYQSLVRNYAGYLIDFTSERLKIFPYQGKPEDTSATVRTEIRKDDGTKVPVNYTLRKTDAGWMAWDVTIEGISYVKSFRTDFGSEIEQKGLDAVIKRLQDQQSSPTTKPGAVKQSG